MDGSVHNREMPLCVYVFHRLPLSQMLWGCTLLMGSLLSSSVQCNWTNLWRYSSNDAYDCGYDDSSSDMMKVMVDTMSTFLLCVHVAVAV